MKVLEENMDSIYNDSFMRMSYVEEVIADISEYLEANPDSTLLNKSIRRLYDVVSSIETVL